MARKLSIQDLSLQGRTVLMRVDFNVPLDNQANITDDTRIVAALPSIRYVLDHGGALILMSHLGRPEGQHRPELSLAPCAQRLSELLKQPVHMANGCIDKATRSQAQALQTGEILLLENLRFHAAEEHPETDPSFAAHLASLGDIYINDAFGTAHRAHSSTTAVANHFPNAAAAGLLLQKEICYLGEHLSTPEHPFHAIVGGKKVSGKLGVLKSLLNKVDSIYLGGAMAFTFLKAEGKQVGSSLVEEELIDTARELIESCKKRNITLHLPSDVRITQEIHSNAPCQTVSIQEGIPDSWMGVDIGPQTAQDFSEALTQASLILWNGPMGIFEIPAFAQGTHAIAQTLASLNARTIAGGGDSVAAVHQSQLQDKFSHLSTGGGATLEYIEQGQLVGIEALSKLNHEIESNAIN